MENVPVRKIKNCRLCYSNNLENVFNLISTPPANSYIKKKDLYKIDKKFKLLINLCKNCGHMQLGHLVDRKKIFSNYLYKTNTGKQNFVHFEKYANKVQKIISKKNIKYKILDIASNDGTFLSFFNKNKFSRIGIDPAQNLKKIVEKKGIKQIASFFTKKNSIKIQKKFGKFEIITANHVCAHLEDLHDFFYDCVMI